MGKIPDDRARRRPGGPTTSLPDHQIEDPSVYGRATALGGDCAADIALLRSKPGVFRPVSADPTILRMIYDLAATGEDARWSQSAHCLRQPRAWVSSRYCCN